LALSGRKFGANYEMHVKQPVELDEQELASLANGVMLSWPNPLGYLLKRRERYSHARAKLMARMRQSFV